jgi:hypothetical protein
MTNPVLEWHNLESHYLFDKRLMIMIETQIREKIQNKLNELDFQELVFVDSLLSNVAAYLQETKQTLKANNQNPKVDSLPSLKDSDFIGCFVDEPNLSEKSEQLAQLILSQQK